MGNGYKAGEMTIPDRMVDRWARRADPAPGQRTLYWLVRMHDDRHVRSLAVEARERLAAFRGLHMTPLARLHLTTLLAGPADQFTDEQIRQMIAIAGQNLSRVPPVTVSLGKILYYTEAIMLAVAPAVSLAPIRVAAIAATRSVTGQATAEETGWRPHVTLCYSTADQPARPIIEALGLQLPARETRVASLSLIAQDGPEREWNWTTLATIRMSAS